MRNNNKLMTEAFSDQPQRPMTTMNRRQIMKSTAHTGVWHVLVSRGKGTSVRILSGFFLQHPIDTFLNQKTSNDKKERKKQSVRKVEKRQLEERFSGRKGEERKKGRKEE